MGFNSAFKGLNNLWFVTRSSTNANDNTKFIPLSDMPILVVAQSAVPWLLELLVRIPLRAWMLRLLCLLCVLFIAVSATGWWLVQRSPTGRVSVCEWIGNLKNETDRAPVGLLDHRKIDNDANREHQPMHVACNTEELTNNNCSA